MLYIYIILKASSLRIVALNKVTSRFHGCCFTLGTGVINQCQNTKRNIREVWTQVTTSPRFMNTVLDIKYKQPIRKLKCIV